jgi:hypothetical protein
MSANFLLTFPPGKTTIFYVYDDKAKAYEHWFRRAWIMDSMDMDAGNRSIDIFRMRNPSARRYRNGNGKRTLINQQ